MRYTTFGKTGVTVSRLCLGTMTFGLQTDEQGARAIMDRAFEAGINFFDTADVYPVGGSLETVGVTEEIVGRWLATHRDDIFLATKAAGQMGRQPFHGGTSRKHLVEAVESSLKRLGTDHIDLYQLHHYDEATPLEEVAAALDHLVSSGKVIYVGVSNYAGYQVARLIGKQELHHLAPLTSIQPRYNLLWREPERDLLPLAAQENIAVIPYNPIAGGLLTGKHRPSGPPPEGTRFTLGSAAKRYQERYWNQQAFSAVEALRTIAARENLELATLALAWVLAHPAITSPIIGASRAEQLEATLAAVEADLSDQTYAELAEITHDFRWWDIS